MFSSLFDILNICSAHDFSGMTIAGISPKMGAFFTVQFIYHTIHQIGMIDALHATRVPKKMKNKNFTH